MDEDDGGWVNPCTYEQFWLPQDLPTPTCSAALGVVLKDGTPRYIFPCIEATVTAGNRLWHNRGLNSLPLGKTWLLFGEVGVDDLRVSAYSQSQPEQTEEEAEAKPTPLVDDVTQSRDWTPVLPLTPVSDALDAIFKILGDAPDDLGQGFAYLIAPLKSSPLPESALAPGQRIRMFLSDVDATPTALDPEDRESWLWNRGECDVVTFQVAAGGESEFLPQVYRPLYDS